MSDPPPMKKKKTQEYKYSWFGWRYSQPNWPERKCLHQVIEDEFKHNKIENYAFQYEPHESGVVHLQGTHNYRSRRGTERKRFTEIGFDDLYPQVTYLEGAARPKDLFEYCSKKERVPCPDCGAEGPWVGGQKPVDDRALTREDLEAFPLSNRPWSEEVYTMCKSEPPVVHNQVYWYWSKHSGAGKNNLQRHLTIDFGSIPLDMFKSGHALGIVYKNPSRIYTVNIPRERYSYISKTGDKVYTPLNYKFLETLSDMYFQASFGTEMTGAVVRKASWIIVFANEPPTGEFYDSERIVCKEIGEDNSFK
jgi:hypothetical protein